MKKADLQSIAYVKAASAWAEVALAGSVATSAWARFGSDVVEDLTSCFRLEPLERRVIDLVLGVESSLAAQRRVGEMTGGGRLCVGVVVAVLGEDALPALAGRGSLRAHGLVTVEGPPASLPGSTARVTLAPGLAARLGGLAPQVDEIGPGIEIVPPATRPALPDTLAEILREQLVDVDPGWVAVSGARLGEAALLAEALAFRLHRAVVTIDARALLGFAPHHAWEVLAAVRRECDLDGAPLIVESAAAIGGAWRALAAPAPHGRPIKPIVIMNGDAVPRRPPAGFVLKAVTFVAEAPPAAVASPAPTTPDALEAARRRGAVDAARALGKPVPGRDQPIRSDVSRAPAAAVPAPAATATEPAPVTPPSPAAVNLDEALAARSAAREAERLAKLAARTATPVDAEAARRRLEGIRARARDKARDEAIAAGLPPPDNDQEPLPPPTRPRPPVAEPLAPAPLPRAEAPPEVADVEAEADPADALPFVDVPDGATVPDLVRLANTCPNPRQRADLMRRVVAMAPKDVQVLRLLRGHASSPHPLVRAAAEDGLATIFGPTWNKSRTIAAPIQPPRSDD